jgi:hypothetical protein
VSEPTEGGTYAVLPVKESDSKFPLTHMAIAVHLGITEYKEDNVKECKRRAKAFIALYERLGKPLLYLGNGLSFKADYVNDAFIRLHLGQRVNFGYRTAEQFDEHLLNIEASLTDTPRMSYRLITFLGAPRLGKPYRIYQEIDDLHRSESRRVEVSSCRQGQVAAIRRRRRQPPRVMRAAACSSR